jgi:hypothetical protein
MLYWYTLQVFTSAHCFHTPPIFVPPYERSPSKYKQLLLLLLLLLLWFYSPLLGLCWLFSFFILYTGGRTPWMGDQSIASINNRYNYKYIAQIILLQSSIDHDVLANQQQTGIDACLT